jgi:hypothetical protein
MLKHPQPMFFLTSCSYSNPTVCDVISTLQFRTSAMLFHWVKKVPCKSGQSFRNFKKPIFSSSPSTGWWCWWRWWWGGELMTPFAETWGRARSKHVTDTLGLPPIQSNDTNNISRIWFNCFQLWFTGRPMPWVFSTIQNSVAQNSQQVNTAYLRKSKEN